MRDLEIKIEKHKFDITKSFKMKKILLTFLSVTIAGGLIFISCKKKNDNSAISPTYAADAGGGGNPNVGVTTTGTINTTSSQQNSSLSGVGQGSQWQSSGCQSGQTCIVNDNTSTGTNIEVCFSGTITAGTYTLVNSSSQLGPGKAVMKVTNPPQQDAGTVWYSSGGTINVTISGSAITGTFNNIVCYQTPGSFYHVSVSGQVGCL